MATKISQEIEQKAKEHVIKLFNIYSNRSGLEDIWEKCDKLYNNISTEKFYEGQANLFPPETRRACKTIINFIDEVLFNSDPPFRIKGVGGSNDEKKAEILFTTINWQQQKIKMRQKVRKMLEPLVKYGFVVVKIPWVLKEKYILKDKENRNNLINKIIGMFSGQVKKDVMTTYDNLDFIPLDIRSVFWNYFDTWENQTCIIERHETSFQKLKLREKAGIYHDVDKVKEDTSSYSNGAKNYNATDQIKTADKFNHIKDLTGLSGNFTEDKDRYELLEAYFEFDIDGDGINEECVIDIVNREHVVRFDLNNNPDQEKPYLHCVWDAIEGTSLGIGLPQLAECSQIALNDFVNQIMDNITMILNNMKIVDELAEIPSSQLKSRPNGVVKSKTGVEAVKFITPPLTAGEGLKAVAMVKDDIRNVTGATVSLQGLPAKYNTTASEYQAQGSASARDVFAKIREIEDQIIKEFLRRAYKFDLEYLTREDFIKIVGKDAAEAFFSENQTIKDGLYGDYDFIPLGMTQIENKIIKTQQYINYLNVVSGLPPETRIQLNILKIAVKIWKNMGDGDDIEIPQPNDTLISPNDENILLSQGETVHAKLIENHQQHILTHNTLQLPTDMDMPKMLHIQEHLNFVQMLSQQQNRTPIPPQEQPRIQPDTITERNTGRQGGMPAEV